MWWERAGQCWPWPWLDGVSRVGLTVQSITRLRRLNTPQLLVSSHTVNNSDNTMTILCKSYFTNEHLPSTDPCKLTDNGENVDFSQVWTKHWAHWPIRFSFNYTLYPKSRFFYNLTKMLTQLNVVVVDGDRASFTKRLHDKLSWWGKTFGNRH